MNLGTGIIMDMITIAILLASTVLGARKGFALTMVSFMQWFVCIICGFIFCGRMKDLLMDYTELDESIAAMIKDHIQTTIEESSTYHALPDLFGGFMESQAETAAGSTAEAITSSLLTVIAFLAVVFGIKIIAFAIVRLFSRRYNEGLTGVVDGFLGFLFGIARGLILILVFYALLVPVLSLLWPGLSEAITGAIDDAYLAKLLYDENVLLILVRDLFV